MSRRVAHFEPKLDMQIQELLKDAVTETGSNENGYWRKWADGTLECWGTKSANVSGSDTYVSFLITLPATAYGNTYYCHGNLTDVINGFAGVFYAQKSSTTTSCYLFFTQIDSVAWGISTTATIRWFMIGRWKA